MLEISYDTELKGNLNNKDCTTVNAADIALEEYLGDEERGLYEITRYINDVNREYTQVLMERDGSGALSTAYVYGNERLSVRSTKKESGYYLYDGRGSVTGIVSILGERLESYSYDPSGQAMRATSTNRYQKTFYGYNAESYDPKTGSVYLRARYYNTRTGSFSTKDTYLGDLMEPLSINRYSYTWGNPVNYQDPSGHDAARQDMINRNRAAAGLPVYDFSDEPSDKNAGRYRGLGRAMTQAQDLSVLSGCGDYNEILDLSAKWIYQMGPDIYWSFYNAAMYFLIGKGYLWDARVHYLYIFASVIKDAAAYYDIPLVLLAGVAFNEYGGDPTLVDDGAYFLRDIGIGVHGHSDPEKTSFGNISMQARRVAETLGYNWDELGEIDKAKIIELLKDPISNIYLAAKYLAFLKDVDYAGIPSANLTMEQIRNIATRYNRGSENSIEDIEDNSGYGQNIIDNYDTIMQVFQ